MAEEPFPEPDLVERHGDPTARAALERLGRETWAAALDWLHGPARERPIAPEPYRAARRAYFGPSDRPGPAPVEPAPSAAVLGEFRDRIAPGVFAAQHPGAFSYFTPPPLPMSIAGEVLAQWVHQGVDVWHAGPVAAFVEEDVTAWLRELVGMGEGSWGVLTSGGVMANLMALAVARDVHLAGRRRPRRRPRLRLRPGALLDRPGARRARLPAGDPPDRRLRRPVPPPRRSRGRRDRGGPRGGAPAARDRRRRRLDEHGLGG